MKNTINRIFMSTATIAVAVIMLLSLVMPVSYGLSEGAYIVNTKVYYAHPRTGKTIDGGTNITLGQSMVEGVVDKTALIENVNGKTYVTIGIGLTSNISKTGIFIEHNGHYEKVAIKKTGSYPKNGDTTIQYRFQMDNTGDLISPALFVIPMGRETKFFIKLNMSSARKGTGNYNSLMFKAGGEEKTREGSNASNASASSNAGEKSKAETKSSKNSLSNDSEKKSSEEKSSEKPSSDEKSTSAKVDEKNNTMSKKVAIIIGIVGVVIAGAVAVVGFLIYRKNKL